MAAQRSEEDRQQEATHIWDVILNIPDTKIRVFGLSNDGHWEPLRELIQYIKRPGLLRGLNLGEGIDSLQDVPFELDGRQQQLSEEEFRMVKCFATDFQTELQNNHGPDSTYCNRIDPLDLRHVTQDEFLTFYRTWDPNNPTPRNDTLRHMSWNLRHGNPSASSTHGNGIIPNPVTSSSTSTSSTKKPASTAVKKNHANYKEITRCEDFRKWWGGVCIAAQSEGVQHVLDPAYTPSSSDDINRHTTNCSHMLNVFNLKGNTTPIQNIVLEVQESKVPFGGQVAAGQIVDYYKDSNIGAIRARELKDKIDRLRIPSNHSGQINKASLEWEGWVNEYNTLVPTDEKITDNLKLSRYKDVVIDIPGFRAVEQVLRLMPATATTSAEKYASYRNMAAILDDDYDRAQDQHLKSGRRTPKELSINALLSSVGNEDEGDGRGEQQWVQVNTTQGRRNELSQQEREQARLPQALFEKLSKDAKNLWRKIPAVDRKIIVECITTIADNARAPSSHSARRVNFHDMLPDANPFELLFDDNTAAADVDEQAISMNHLSINTTESHVNSPPPTPEDKRALSILMAAASPVPSATVDRPTTSHPTGSILRALSSSACPSPPSSRITRNDRGRDDDDNNNDDDDMSYEYDRIKRLENDVIAKMKENSGSTGSMAKSEEDPGSVTNDVQQSGENTGSMKFTKGKTKLQGSSLMKKVLGNLSPARKSKDTTLSMNMVRITSNPSHYDHTNMQLPILRHDVPGSPMIGQEIARNTESNDQANDDMESAESDGNAGSDGVPTNWRYEPWNGDGQPPWNWRSAPNDEFGFRRNHQDSTIQPAPLSYPEYTGSDADDKHGKHLDISDETIYEAYSPTPNDYVILVPRTVHSIPIAGNYTELVRYEEPPLYINIKSREGYKITRARIGTFRFVMVDETGREVMITCEGMAHIGYGPTYLVDYYVREKGHLVRPDEDGKLGIMLRSRNDEYEYRADITYPEEEDESDEFTNLHFIPSVPGRFPEVTHGATLPFPMFPVRVPIEKKSEYEDTLTHVDMSVIFDSRGYFPEGFTPSSEPTLTVNDDVAMYLIQQRRSEYGLPASMYQMLESDRASKTRTWTELRRKGIEDFVNGHHGLDAEACDVRDRVEMCDLNNGRMRATLTQEVKRFKILCRSAREQIPTKVPLEFPHLLMGHIFKNVSDEIHYMITEITILGAITDMSCEDLGLRGNLCNEVHDEDSPISAIPLEIGPGIRLSGYNTESIEVVCSQVGITYREDWQHKRVMTHVTNATPQQGMSLHDFIVECNSNTFEGDDIIGAHRSREWHKLMFQSVMAELIEVIIHTSTEVGLYRRHLSVDIAKQDDVEMHYQDERYISRQRPITYSSFSKAMLFIVKYGKVIHNSRFHEIPMRKTYSELPNNSTRKNLNHRISNMAPVHDYLRSKIHVVHDDIIIHELGRAYRLGHVLMFPIEVLEYLRVYNFEHNVVIESLIYGNASTHAATASGDTRRLKPFNPKRSISMTATAFQDHLHGSELASIDPNDMPPWSIPPFHKEVLEYGTHIGRRTTREPSDEPTAANIATASTYGIMKVNTTDETNAQRYSDYNVIDVTTLYTLADEFPFLLPMARLCADGLVRIEPPDDAMDDDNESLTSDDSTEDDHENGWGRKRTKLEDLIQDDSD